MTKSKWIKIITYASIFAATLVVARMFAVAFLKDTTPIGKLLKATKEIQFYVIPAWTLYAVIKFGKKTGWIISLLGVAVGFIISFMTQFIVIFGPISVVFDYLVPWIIMTLIAFVPLNSIVKAVLSVNALWFLCLCSWAISGVLHWGLKPYSKALLWAIFSYNGWIMWIILPIVVLAFSKKFKETK